jgi:hypothetical protein
MTNQHQRYNALMKWVARQTNSTWWSDTPDGRVLVSFNHQVIQARVLTLTNLALIVWLIREVRR